MKNARIAIIGLIMLLGACGSSSTFVASKDGRGYYLGNSKSAAYEMFCQSGDLKKILADTSLAQEMREELYQYNCGADRSNDKVRKLYASMTADQRKDLRRAFKRNGYDVNYIQC